MGARASRRVPSVKRVAVHEGSHGWRQAEARGARRVRRTTVRSACPTRYLFLAGRSVSARAGPFFRGIDLQCCLVRPARKHGGGYYRADPRSLHSFAWAVRPVLSTAPTKTDRCPYSASRVPDIAFLTLTVRSTAEKGRIRSIGLLSAAHGQQSHSVVRLARCSDEESAGGGSKFRPFPLPMRASSLLLSAFLLCAIVGLCAAARFSAALATDLQV